MIVFEPKAYNNHSDRLVESIHQLGGTAYKGRLETKKFSDGEVYHRFLTDVRNKNVVIVGSAEKDSEFMELFDLGCAAVKYGAKTLSFVIPYFGYSTMERAVKEGEVVKAKTRARLFSSVPLAHQGNNIFLMDLHVDTLVHYFEGSINAIQLSAVPVLIEKVKEKITERGVKDFIVASADMGRSKMVQKICQELSCDCAFIVKKRDGDKVSAQPAGVDCKDKVVIIYDDMIRSGNSIVAAKKVYMSHGAKEVWVVTTHGVFTEKNNLELNLIENKFLTNSHDNYIVGRSRGSVIVDTMPLFAKALIGRIL